MSTHTPSITPAGAPRKKEDRVSRTAAEEAVDLLLQLHERQRAGKVVDAEFVAMVKGVNRGDDPAPTPPFKLLEQSIGEHLVALKLAASAAACIALYYSVLAIWPLWSGFSVAGKVSVVRTAAPGVELVFHSGPTFVEVCRVVSDTRGEFVVALRRGPYTITARPTGPQRIAGIYAAPQTSPLALNVEKELTGIHLHLAEETVAPTPRK